MGDLQRLLGEEDALGSPLKMEGKYGVLFFSQQMII